MMKSTNSLSKAAAASAVLLSLKREVSAKTVLMIM